MKKIFALFVLVFGILFLLVKHGENMSMQSVSTNSLVVFSQTGCSHCRHALAFIKKTIQPKYPKLDVQILDIKDRKNLLKLINVAKSHNLKEDDLMTPVILLNGKIFVGWQPEYESKLLSLIQSIFSKKDLTRAQK